MATYYDWKRFWFPLGSAIHALDDGYLDDPDAEYGRLFNKGALSIHEIDELPCLILQGDPGIGKTTAVREQFEFAAKRHGRKAMSFDLGEYGDEGRLIDDVFGSSEFRIWSAGDETLDLYLDSLDECRLQIPQVAKVIARELERRSDKLSRLRLRVTCRTADWPAFLTEHLEELWGKSVPKTYELAPLRKIDVASAAEANGIASEKFLAEVSRSSAQALAMKPVTLNFLIRSFFRNGRLPSSQAELYRQGCLLLCEENNPERVGAGHIGKYSATDRLLIAERIAALVVLGNKPAIALSYSEADEPDDLLPIDDVIGDAASLPEASRPPIELVRETLKSGLFSARGPQSVGFSHRTYAEYLAARYIMQTVPKTGRRLDLFRHSGSSSKIVPQLHESAAWIANVDSTFFDDVAHDDPQVLLRSDVAEKSPEQRRRLTQALLELADREELIESDRNDRSHYHKLAHPTLADQLRPYLVDVTKVDVAREFAAGLADACEIAELHPALIDLAIDSKASRSLRYVAVAAAVQFREPELRSRLKSFALSPVENVSDIEIQSQVLRNLWQKEISSAELFAVMKDPVKNSSGSHGYFVGHEIPKRLDVSDLPFALGWIAKRSTGYRHDYYVGKLINHVTRCAWQHCDDKLVLAAMIDYCLECLRGHHPIVPTVKESFEADEATRRSLVAGIVPRIDDFEKQGFGLLYHEPQLVRHTDVSWMLTRLATETDLAIGRRWVKIIGRALNRNDVAQVDEILTACETSPLLREEFQLLLDGIPIDSDAARAARKTQAMFDKHERDAEARRNPPLVDPPPEVRIELNLADSEAGKDGAWSWLVCNLQLLPNSADYDDDLTIDLRKLPGWKTANEETRRRIIEAAKRHLDNFAPRPKKWLGKNSMPRGEFDGYKALALLANEARPLLVSIDAKIWARWAPVIVSTLDRKDNGNPTKLYQRLSRRCFAKAPKSVILSLRWILRHKEPADNLFILPVFCDVHCPARLQAALEHEIETSALHPAVCETLFDFLLEKNSVSVRQHLEAKLLDPLPTSESDAWKRLVSGTAHLIRHSPDAAWVTVWPVLKEHPDFAREVIQKVAYKEFRKGSLPSRLSETDTTETFLWLEDQYPRSKDPPHDSWPGPREAVIALREELFRSLRDSGTSASIQGLMKIQTARPDWSWMPRIIAEAKAKWLRKTWNPLPPQEILMLTQRPTSRLVRNAAQLREVILESLQSLEADLQDETPAVRDLWDKTGSGFRPKEENELSDYIKRHLIRDLKACGIVSLREVEIRRSLEGSSGERTDLHVTGIVPGLADGMFDQVRVIIEVKGQWHADVKTAMKTQLVDRYLKDNSCRDGIYLVGWFRCPQWDSSDSRSTKSKSDTFDGLSDYLHRQAAELSDGGLTVSAFVLNAALRVTS